MSAGLAQGSAASGGTPRPAGAAGLAPVPAQVVSFALTGSHFAAALVFLLAGAAGLVGAAPELAAGRYLSREVVAVTHLFTLGWLTTSIMGALYQLFPVVLGSRAGSERLGYASLALYAPGLVLFIGGMLAGGTSVLLVGAALFATGLLLFAGNAAAGLVRAPKRDLTWWCVGGAVFFLVVTVVLGASLAANLRWFHLGENRLLAVGVHMHVALGGWVLLMVIGVGRRLLPMFLLSHGGSTRPASAAALLVGAGALLLTLFHHAPGPHVPRLSAVLLASGTAAFLVQAAIWLRRSHRPALDAGLRLAASGALLLAAAIPLGMFNLAGRFTHARLNGAYGAVLVLGFALFVIGHYYKILPFLVWNHRYAPLVMQGRRLPRVADLFSARAAQAAFGLLAAGSLIVVVAAAAGLPLVARMGGAAFGAGAGIAAIQMFNLFRTRPQP